MNYVLAEFSVNENKYVFRFDDGRYTYIDLSNDFPEYKWCKQSLCNEYWHFTVIKNNSNNSKKVGSIEEFEYIKLRKMDTNIKEFWLNNILYRISNQTEYDKYLFNQKTNCDNAKVFDLLNSMYYEAEAESEAESEAKAEAEAEAEAELVKINNKIKITYV